MIFYDLLGLFQTMSKENAPVGFLALHLRFRVEPPSMMNGMDIAQA